MSPLKTFIQSRGEARWRSFDEATKKPEAAQARLLLNILSRNQDTEYGRVHGFSQITDARSFAEAVPVNTFSDLAPYIEKMKEGRENILTAEPLVMFNLTSGTTDKPKFLPVTRKGRELTARASRLWFYRALLDHPSYLDNSVFLISGARIEGRTPAGVPYGSASGMVLGSLPQRLRRTVLPPAVSEIKDYDLRYYLMARLSLAEEISFIGTPNPTTLIRIAETGILHQDEIIRSIHDGTTGRAIPRKIVAALRPDPARARFLEGVIRRHSELLPSACWPELKLIGCWLGGSVGFQAAKLARYYGENTPKRDIGYMASEGSMTIPHEDNTPAGILALDNNYYEFIPEDENNTPHRPPLRCHELEPGGRYRIVLTNWNGLYRYDINDIIEVRGFYHRTPVIAFLRKGEDMLNITGEKLHVNHIIKAFERLEEELKLTVDRFRVVPNYEKTRYEILMRPPRELPKEYLKNTVLPFIDEALCEANIEYNAKRKSKRLLPPCIHLMAPAWEEAARRNNHVQYKWRMTSPEMSEPDAGQIIETIEA